MATGKDPGKTGIDMQQSGDTRGQVHRGSVFAQHENFACRR
jgi:hypothetical protein